MNQRAAPRPPREIGQPLDNYAPDKQFQGFTPSIARDLDRPHIEPAAAPQIVNFDQFERDMNRKPLTEIAKLVQSLTYGEMIELAEAMWRAKPEGVDITAESLPAVLHRWSKEGQ